MTKVFLVLLIRTAGLGLACSLAILFRFNISLGSIECPCIPFASTHNGPIPSYYGSPFVTWVVRHRGYPPSWHIGYPIGQYSNPGYWHTPRLDTADNWDTPATGLGWYNAASHHSRGHDMHRFDLPFGHIWHPTRRNNTTNPTNIRAIHMWNRNIPWYDPTFPVEMCCNSHTNLDPRSVTQCCCWWVGSSA